MPIPPKITFCLASLAKPLEAWCDRTGQSPSQACREAVAQMLGVQVPSMSAGNPTFTEKKKAKKGYENQ